MAPGNDDIALNTRGTEYHTGIIDRVQLRVIRVRTDLNIATGCSNSKNTPNIDDQTGAGKTWSDVERDIANFHPHRLAVVVGAYLPAGLSPSSSSGQVKTHVIVRRVYECKSVLYILQTKARGLCVIAALPKTEQDRVFYYSEWTDGMIDIKPQNKRKRALGNRLTDFCKQLLNP